MRVPMKSHKTFGASARFDAIGLFLVATARASALPAMPSEAELRKLAVSLTGARFKVGGTSRSTGLDSRGLAALLLQGSGVRIPSREDELGRQGARVDAAALEA